VAVVEIEFQVHDCDIDMVHGNTDGQAASRRLVSSLCFNVAV
jgi:hypothetical protein